MKRWIVFALTLLLYGVTQRSGMAQTQIEMHACTAQGNSYNCDRHGFEEVLGAAKTISIQVPRRDPTSFKQLQQLVTSLGKTVQPVPADLLFVLTNPEPDGIYYGPADRKLAILSVYYNASSPDPGQLIWVESYFGQPNTPWPTAAHAVIEQFRKNIKRP